MVLPLVLKKIIILQSRERSNHWSEQTLLAFYPVSLFISYLCITYYTFCIFYCFPPLGLSLYCFCGCQAEVTQSNSIQIEKATRRRRRGNIGPKIKSLCFLLIIILLQFEIKIVDRSSLDSHVEKMYANSINLQKA